MQYVRRAYPRPWGLTAMWVLLIPLLAAACAANIWLAFSIPGPANGTGRPIVVDVEAP